MRLKMRRATPPANENGSCSRRIAWSDVVVRGGVEPPTFRFSGGRSYQLSYLTKTGAKPSAGSS
jgi:hypothetical protein